MAGCDGHDHSARGPRRAALGAGVAVAGVLAYLGIADPHRPGFLFPGCPFKMLTGWNCPACGGLRMTHDLLHADFATALVDNAFVLMGAPMLAGWLLIRWRMGKRLMPAPALAVLVFAAVTWTIARNLPGFPLIPTFHGG